MEASLNNSVRINRFKKRLHELLNDTEGVVTDEVLKLSQELDQLILTEIGENNNYKLNNKKQNK